ncbi:MAG: oligopeptide ABC transporter permease AppB [Anaerolineae bacterium]
MYKYVIRRLLQAIPTLFGITLISFLIMSAAPGGPARALSFGPNVSPQQRQRLEAQLGVNDPWPLQYLYWMIGDDWVQRDFDGDGELDAYGTRKGILRGDFGNSFVRGRRPVTELIGQFILPTLELTTSALLVGLLIGVPVGLIAAVFRGGWFDNLTRVLAVVFNAVPNFWLGLILILVFGSWLEVLPLSGRCPDPTAEDLILGRGCPPIYQRLEFLILPTFTLGTVYIAGYSRYMRTAMLDVIGQDYMRTAQAKGLSNRMVWFRHGARNALIPLATFLGPAITGLLGGAVLTETIFSWPGLGRLAIQSVTQLDYPVLMATVLLGAVATIIGFIISDILYAIIDPRIRFF